MAAIDPQESDPNQLGYSLANVAEILLPCLDAVGAKSVLEIGAYRGELTAALLDWAAESGAKVCAVEPEPPDELLRLARTRPELELLEETSHDVLRGRGRSDAVVIDGDHNYFTLRTELELIAEAGPAEEMPLLLFHDLCWPHARRDTYYAPERIPAEHRQPLARDAGLAPGEPGVVENGLPFTWAAAREGGERNGTLTAIEDWSAAHGGMRLAIVPAFFGFGILWHEGSARAGAVAEVVAPWDRNPVLARMEANRVAHLVSNFARARELEREREWRERQEELLCAMLGSSAFALAERLASLRSRGRPTFSREKVRRALGR